MNPGTDLEIAVRGSGYEHGMHIPIGAVPVVRAQVPCIGRCLVDVSLCGGCFSLQLEDDDSSTNKQDNVGTSRFQREFVFQYGRVAIAVRLRFDHLTDFGLQLGY